MLKFVKDARRRSVETVSNTLLHLYDQYMI